MKIILFVFAIIPTLLFGQKVKKVNDKKNKEVYWVLKSDNSKRHGTYEKKGYNNSVLIKGFYKNGVKDSVWMAYNHKGELEQKIDFTNNKILFYKPEDNAKDSKNRVVIGSDTIEAKLDRPPIYIGGLALILESIIKNVIYPQLEREANISGTVYITFTIDSTGKTSNYRVTKGISLGCDAEALRVIKEIPENWFPGILNGKEVNVEYEMPLRFSLR